MTPLRPGVQKIVDDEYNVGMVRNKVWAESLASRIQEVLTQPVEGVEDRDLPRFVAQFINDEEISYTSRRESLDGDTFTTEMFSRGTLSEVLTRLAHVVASRPRLSDEEMERTVAGELDYGENPANERPHDLAMRIARAIRSHYERSAPKSDEGV